MSLIARGRGALAPIDLFTVAPDQLQESIDLLTQAANEIFRHSPGFVSAYLYRSLDDGKVVNNAQWRSKADFEAMRANPEARQHFHAAAAFACFEPIFYEVSSVFGVA